MLCKIQKDSSLPRKKLKRMYTTITGVTIVFPRSLFKIMPNTDREWENVLLKLEMLSLAYTEIIGILEKS